MKATDMDRHLPDDQLDRALLGFFSKRGDELLATAPTAHLVAARIAATVAPMPVRRRRGGGRTLVGVTLVIILTLLGLGAILVSAGRAPSLVPAERGVFRTLPPMSDEREWPSVTVLADGRVLVVGGYGAGESSAELWDPATEAFERTVGEPLHGRGRHAGVLLADGRVLLVGGVGIGERQEADGTTSITSEPVLEAETWDPATGVFSAAGTMQHAFARLEAVVQPDGTVLVTGLAGDAGALAGGPPVAEVWDPASLMFRPAPAPAAEAVAPGVWLRDGRRLLTEERLGDVWDPSTDSVVHSGPSEARHQWVPATLLADGRVLIAGGDGSFGAHECGTSAEIWDPATATFSHTSDLDVPRTGHGAALLLDGRVLIVGNWGATLGPCPGRDSAEIFELR
jgi:hypothetical protein